MIILEINFAAKYNDMILPETKTLAHLFEDCTSKYPDLTVNTMVGWTSGQTYQELKEKAGRLSILLDSYGVGSGDKVAILSAGHPNWIAAFFSATAFGRVAVPLLPDFSPSVVANVLAHSEAKALFVSAKCYEKLSAETLAALSLVIDIDTLEPIAGNKMVEEGANSSVTGASAATVEAAGTSAKAEAAASAAETSAAVGPKTRNILSSVFTMVLNLCYISIVSAGVSGVTVRLSGTGRPSAIRRSISSAYMAARARMTLRSR